jgi:hypothetical protein
MVDQLSLISAHLEDITSSLHVIAALLGGMFVWVSAIAVNSFRRK